jgi:hypothetical protein
MTTYDDSSITIFLNVPDEPDERSEPREVDVTKVDIAEWQRRLDAGGPPQPSPTILDARCAGYPSLTVSCAACGHAAHIPLESIRRPPDTPLADLLPDLRCTRCGAKGPPDVAIKGVHSPHTEADAMAVTL